MGIVIHGILQQSGGHTSMGQQYDNEACNMVTERSISLDGKTCTAVISDEPEALLAAKAAGRAVVGVEREGEDIWDIKGIPYVIPDIED